MTRVQELITEINCSTEGWNPYNIGRVTGAVILGILPLEQQKNSGIGLMVG